MTIGLRHTWLAVVMLAGAVGAAAGAQGAPDALSDFSQRLERYVELRARYEEPLPPLRPSRGEWTTVLARRYLASAIRTARSTARPGDVFTPAIEAMFRQRIDGGLTAADRMLLTRDDDAEGGHPVVLVNEPLPGEWLTEAPPALAHQLPALPAGLEYRFVHTDLVLWDTHAEIVVDVLADALR